MPISGPKRSTSEPTTCSPNPSTNPKSAASCSTPARGRPLRRIRWPPYNGFSTHAERSLHFQLRRDTWRFSTSTVRESKRTELSAHRFFACPYIRTPRVLNRFGEGEPGICRKPGTDMNFRRSLPEIRCLSLVCPAGHAPCSSCPPKRLSTRTPPATRLATPPRYNRYRLHC